MLLLLFPHGYAVGGGSIWTRAPALATSTWTKA